MAYLLYRFGASQLLPLGDPQGNVAGGDVASDAVEVAGGVTHYAYGDDVAPLRRHTIAHSGIYSSSVRTNVDGLAGLLGQRQQLWRQREADGVLQWKWARMTSFRWQRDVGQIAHAAVDCTFEAEGNWKSSSANTFQRTGTGTRTVTNSGTANVWEPWFYYTCSSAGTNTFRLEESTLGIDISWTGSMSGGHSLYIYPSTWTVLNNGADAYSGLTINAGHTAQRWLVWPAGTHTVTCTVSAGAGAFTFQHYDEWV